MRQRYRWWPRTTPLRAGSPPPHRLHRSPAADTISPTTTKRQRAHEQRYLKLELSNLFGEMFEVESYLRHQSSTFAQRFDANSYLTITQAMDYFDVAAVCGGDLAAALEGRRTRFLLASLSSDWLFPTSASRSIVRALNRAGANVSFVELPADKGHDAFLLDEPNFHRTLAGFLRGARRAAGMMEELCPVPAAGPTLRLPA